MFISTLLFLFSSLASPQISVIGDELFKLTPLHKGDFKLDIEHEIFGSKDRQVRRIVFREMMSNDVFILELTHLDPRDNLDGLGYAEIYSGSGPVPTEGFSGLPIGLHSRHTASGDTSWETKDYCRGWMVWVTYGSAVVDREHGNRNRVHPATGHEAEITEGIARVVLARMIAKECETVSPPTLSGKRMTSAKISPNGTILVPLKEWADAAGVTIKENYDMTIELTKGTKKLTIAACCDKARSGKEKVSLEDYTVMIGETVYIPVGTIQARLGS